MLAFKVTFANGRETVLFDRDSAAIQDRLREADRIALEQHGIAPVGGWTIKSIAPDRLTAEERDDMAEAERAALGQRSWASQLDELHRALGHAIGVANAEVVVEMLRGSAGDDVPAAAAARIIDGCARILSARPLSAADRVADAARSAAA